MFSKRRAREVSLLILITMVFYVIPFAQPLVSIRGV